MSGPPHFALAKAMTSHYLFAHFNPGKTFYGIVTQQDPMGAFLEQTPSPQCHPPASLSSVEERYSPSVP